MGALHDALKASGYTGHALEVLLVRLLFCLFAEDVAYTESGVSVREALDLWDMPIVFLVLALLLGSEWGVRRARGLA